MQEAFELSDEQVQRLLEPPSRASLVDAGEHLHVTLYVAGGEGGEPVLRPVECVLGPNWVVTAHEAEIEVLEEFRERAEGGGQIGALDSPSFVAAVVEWVVTSYFRAFEDVESELEELDAKVMSEIPKNVADELGRLVELRRSIGTLRRALSPHREVIVALAHPELDLLSTEGSAQRFAALESRRGPGGGCGARSEGVDPRLVRPSRRPHRPADKRHREAAHARHGDSPAGKRARRRDGDELQGRPLRPGVDVLGRDRRDARHRRARPLSRPQPPLDLAASAAEERAAALVKTVVPRAAMSAPFFPAKREHEACRQSEAATTVVAGPSRRANVTTVDSLREADIRTFKESSRRPDRPPETAAQSNRRLEGLVRRAGSLVGASERALLQHLPPYRFADACR